mmetsp:Transcript_15038/g.46701  ORF Transcript_15038/g.46701 Transcript_15038/m.46701 type:complete len:108 (+) Transcript_15038:180-503(+)
MMGAAGQAVRLLLVVTKSVLPATKLCVYDWIGHYHGYCRRSCLYCGPTPIPTLPQPSSAPSTRYPTLSQIPTANCDDGFLLRDARDFLRRELNLSGLCAMFVCSAKA